MPASASERRVHLRELLFERPALSTQELARHFEVSAMTIRRDLESLGRSGQVRRVRGGAELTGRMVFEFDYRARREEQREYKAVIAREARKLVAPGQRLLIDNGTTTLELAALLSDCPGLTVITPSLAVVSELIFAGHVEVILLGGIVRPGSADLTGSVTEHCLELFAADLAFQGADGIGLDGAIYNTDLRLAEVDRKMRRCADRSVILADTTKIGRTALARNGFLGRDADIFITDERLDPAQRELFEAMGMQLVIARKPERDSKAESEPNR